MKRNIVQATLQTTIVAIALLATTTTVAIAEIPLKTMVALQNSSSEKLLIEVQTVEKKRNLTGGFDLEVNAKVLEAKASKAGLGQGNAVTIRYWIHDPQKFVPSGSYPIEVKKGKRYRAYLGPPVGAYRRLADKQRKVYFPTAASGSFEETAGPASPKP